MNTPHPSTDVEEKGKSKILEMYAIAHYPTKFHPDYDLVLRAIDAERICKDLLTTQATTHQATLAEVVKEKIICSAVRYNDKVWRGHRHGDAIQAMRGELSYTMNRKELNEAQVDRDQGFVTSEGRYVNRAEAWSIAEKAGQIIDREYQTKDCLYSEDLW